MSGNGPLYESKNLVAKYGTLSKSIFSCFAHARDFQSFLPRSGKMSSSVEVKEEIVGKLSEANANEKYLYSRVMELEKRNQRLEKKVRRHPCTSRLS